MQIDLGIGPKYEVMFLAALTQWVRSDLSREFSMVATWQRLRSL